MAITTTSVLPPPVQQAFNNKLLSVPVPLLIHGLPAMKFKMERASGNTMRFRRYNKLATAKVPLGNSGVTPPASTLTAVDIDAKIDFYGNWIAINEQVTLQAQDRPLNEAAVILGLNLRETEDQLIRDMLAATASVINCVSGVNGDNPTEITRSDVDQIVRTLLGNDSKSIFENIEGENKFGTAPVRNSFMALAHTDLSADLNNVSGFVPSAQYPSQKNILQAEYGSVSQLRFMLSSIGSISNNASNNGANVYNIFCVGQEAVGIVDQDGAGAQFIYLPPQYSGPLALNSSAAWKAAFVPRILNDLWILNLRATLSA
jgi:N4-gp56 family major capsid protein